MAAQGAVLGLLALLLGFTFSLALSHFDARTAAVVDEANAIGTAWLRTDLLPEPERTEARDLMKQYVAVRVKASVIPLEHETDREDLVRQAQDIGARIWTWRQGALGSGVRCRCPLARRSMTCWTALAAAMQPFATTFRRPSCWHCSSLSSPWDSCWDTAMAQDGRADATNLCQRGHDGADRVPDP